MPRSTQNSQATPLVEVESDGNRPSSCDVVGVSATNASPPGDANASQPFLATVLQAVKAALAAEQVSVPCPASMALPNQGQSSSTASPSSAMAFGSVPSLLSSQATAFAAFGAVFAAHSTSAGSSAAQGRPAFVLPTFVSTFLPPNPLAFTVHCQHGDHVVPGKRFICCHVAPGQHFASDFVLRAKPALHCRSWLLPRSCESSRPSGGGEVH